MLLALYLLLGAAYQHRVPLFEAPDEPSHLEYVAFLSVEGRLPRHGERPEVPGEGWQAPLYYLLAVPLLRASVDGEELVLGELHRSNLSTYQYAPGADQRNQLLRHVRPPREPRRFWPDERLSPLRHVRWLSLLLGALAVSLTYRAVRSGLGDATLALFAAALLALNPQFLFVSSYVNNDTAAAAVGAAGFALVARASRHRAGIGLALYVGLALLIGVGVLSKVSTLVGLAIAGLAIFLMDERPLRRRVADAAMALVPLILVLLPYLVWDAQHRGGPLGLGAVRQLSRHLAGPEDFGGLANYLRHMYVRVTFESYWARFGWLNVRSPTGVYAIFLALAVAGLAGFVRGALAGRQRAFRLYLVAAIGANLAAHLWLNLEHAQPQGRHLFPVAPQIACVLALGLAGLGRAGSDRLPAWAAGLVLALLLGLAAYALLGVIGPAYA